MPQLSAGEIRDLTVELLKTNIVEMKKEEIIEAIQAESPETPRGTISTQINMAALMWPDRIQRPRRGLYLYAG